MMTLPIDCLRIIYQYCGYPSLELRCVSQQWYHAYSDIAFYICDDSIDKILKYTFNVRGIYMKIRYRQLHQFWSNGYIQDIEISNNTVSDKLFDSLCEYKHELRTLIATIFSNAPYHNTVNLLNILNYRNLILKTNIAPHTCINSSRSHYVKSKQIDINVLTISASDHIIYNTVLKSTLIKIKYRIIKIKNVYSNNLCLSNILNSESNVWWCDSNSEYLYHFINNHKKIKSITMTKKSSYYDCEYRCPRKPYNYWGVIHDLREVWKSNLIPAICEDFGLSVTIIDEFPKTLWGRSHFGAYYDK